mmetsp:Transcript_18610/g.47299  ORF Transcript_18610/g.47299 Transcript_18610/m.47299 type:complete len:86 (-) Transcript_18610:413-670(-)
MPHLIFSAKMKVSPDELGLPQEDDNNHIADCYWVFREVTDLSFLAMRDFGLLKMDKAYQFTGDYGALSEGTEQGKPIKRQKAQGT